MSTLVKEKTNLKYIFESKSIVVVGASNTVGKVGYAVIYNLKHSGFTGKLYPVNPKHDQVVGIPAYKKVSDIPDKVETAIVIVPPPVCAKVLEACGQKGIKAVVVITAGFKEVGPEGKVLEDKVAQIAKKYNISLIGPNCLGIINTDPEYSMNASFATDMPSEGNVAFLSQSGALCTAVLDYAKGINLGFSKFISIGNKADINELDLLNYLAEDDKTKVILMYIEDLVDGHEFIKVGSRITREINKPIIAIKSGRTTQGAAAASSHTGSLAGSDKVYDAIFKQSKVIRVDSFEELFNLAVVFSQQPIPLSNKTAIVTNAGGPGIMATDACVEHNLELAELEEKTVAELKKVLPPVANFHNPIDVIGDARDDRYEAAVKIILEDPNIDNLIVLLTPQCMTNTDEIARALVRVQKPGKVMIAVFMGMADVTGGINILRKNKIPCFLYPLQAAKSIEAMLTFKTWHESKAIAPKKFKVDRSKAEKLIKKNIEQGRKQMDMEDVFEIFKAYSFSMPNFWKIVDKKELDQLPINYPVVLKIISKDIIHKIDIGGVILKIKSLEQLKTACAEMEKNISVQLPQAKIEGFFVQEMASRAREAILGVNRDPHFGPLLMFGMGGTYVEVFKDVSFRLAPVNEVSAQKMIEDTRFNLILKGKRGYPEADYAALIETICRLSQLVIDFPEIQELDINPIFVYDKNQGVKVIDGRITLKV